MCLSADLFSLFASESGGYAARDDMEAVLRAVDGEVPPSLRKCFSEVSHLSITQTDTSTDAHDTLLSQIQSSNQIKWKFICHVWQIEQV